jgi:protein tyrosine/serine phosphatase
LPGGKAPYSRIISVSLTHPNFETASSSVDNADIRSVKRVSVIAPAVKRLGVLLASILSAAFGWAGLYLGALQLGGNFHTVVPGELYRSAQPTAALIAEYQENYSIKTIINLRGDNTGSSWYDAEVAEAKKLGIAHVDFRMSARRMMTMEQFSQIIDVFQKAEKPILVHCKSGSDRSGLVSALYVAAIAKLGEEAAESQISFWYGHIPLSISAPYAMDRSFEAFEPVLGFPNS